MEEELINFTKLQLVSNVLTNLKKTQVNMPKYKTEKFLHSVDDLQNYFSDNSKVSLLGKGKMTEEIMSEKEIYQGSITIEPRNRGDSPKVRFLSSFFLFFFFSFSFLFFLVLFFLCIFIFLFLYFRTLFFSFLSPLLFSLFSLSF